MNGTRIFQRSIGQAIEAASVACDSRHPHVTVGKRVELSVVAFGTCVSMIQCSQYMWFSLQFAQSCLPRVSFAFTMLSARVGSSHKLESK